MESVNRRANSNEIEFGGRIIRVTPVALVPVMNTERTIANEPVQPTLLSTPTSQTGDSRRVESQGSSGVFTEADIRRFFHLKAQQYAAMAPDLSPEMRAFLDSELRVEMLRFNMVTTASASVQNEEDADDEVGDDMNEETNEGSDEETALVGEQECVVDPGLNEEQIAFALKTEKYKATTTASGCTICWEEYKDGEDMGKLDCDYNHKFHAKCIKPWLMRHNSCPICRMIALIL